MNGRRGFCFIHTNTVFLVSVSIFLFLVTGRCSWISAQTPGTNFTVVTGTDILPQGARLAIVGDSITEALQYSRIIEAYLVACAGRRDMHIFNYGWSGETAGTFCNRLEHDISLYTPTAATVCFGMNDGMYRPFDKTIAEKYETNMRAVLTRLISAGVQTVVVGSPGAVDTWFFNENPPNPHLFSNVEPAACYNETLRRFRDIDEKLAAEYYMPFADIHTALVTVMKNAKNAYGTRYPVCGAGGGYHPSANGGFVMAYVFLKTLGCRGCIGEITVDMHGPATTSSGHRILQAGNGRVEIESRLYPFCFDADLKDANSTRSIQPFIAFNRELNRLILKVSNLSSPRARVLWGSECREFTREQLNAGINLTEEFVKTPFDETFLKFLKSVEYKQQFETVTIKQVWSGLRWLNHWQKQQAGDETELKNAEQLIRGMLRDFQTRREKALYDSLSPVKHTIVIENVS